MTLKRGEIYYITFPYTFDIRYPNGKSKFVLILQEGDYFAKFDTVEILLITSDADCQKPKYITNVKIPDGSTKLKKASWVLCAQPYPISKKLFEQHGVWCAGRLSPETMDDVDAAIYEGLCMGLQHELCNQPDDSEEASEVKSELSDEQVDEQSVVNS